LVNSVANSASRVALVPVFHGNWNLSSVVYFVRATRAFFAVSSAVYAFLIVASVALSFASASCAAFSAAANVSHPPEYRFSFSSAD